MKRHSKHKGHFIKLGLIAAISLAWLIIRTGRKPSRITYPCQRAAVANINIFAVALFMPIVNFTQLKPKLPHILDRGKINTLLLIITLVLALGAIHLDNGNYSAQAIDDLAVPLDLKPQSAITPTNSSDLYFVENASGIEGNMDNAISRLLRLTETHGLFFYKTTSQPDGLIGKEDFVLIKVNSQWPQRGGTNTDLVKSLIKKIINHPEGFTGEILIADNGQELGSMDWSQTNAFNRSQSMLDVASVFSSHRVSTWLWDTITWNTVREYDQNDFRDGYVFNYTRNPTTRLYVSYPKFKTKYNTLVSFKNGIWSNATKSYDTEKLKVINFPVLKSHQGYGVTASVKHYMGVVSARGFTGAHLTIRYGGMGTEIAETRFPILNILDAVYVNANPVESGTPCGPDTAYQDASFTNVLGASQDPVALDYWASKHILIPAAIHKNYTAYSSLDPDYTSTARPRSMLEWFHNYLERSMTELKKAGYRVTMNETEMNVYISYPPITANVEVNPASLNPRSKGNWITVYIQLPKEYDASEINATAVLMNETASPILDAKYGFVTNSSEYIVDHNSDGTLDRMVKFDRGAVVSLVRGQGIRDGNVSLTINGELYDGTSFEGKDNVSINYAGDLNYDGLVNIYDASIISAHWYPGPPAGPLAYESNLDLNRDGAIDILDAATVSAFWTGPPKGPKAI